MITDRLPEFQHRLDIIIPKIPYTDDSYADAEEYLDNITKFIVDTAVLTNANHRKCARDWYIDCVSLQFPLTSWHLQTIIEFRLHLTGQKHRTGWTNILQQRCEIQGLYSEL